MGERLKPGELDFWNQYLRSLPKALRPVEPRVTAGPAGPWASTDDLVALLLSGRKTAGSSLVADFSTHGDPLPEVGDFWVHAELYEPHLASWGVQRIDDAEVITEFFTVVFAEPASGSQLSGRPPAR